MDGRVDPARVVDEALGIADFDVLCVQEVADNYADPRLAGSRGEDQFEALARHLRGYAAIPGIAVDVPEESFRRRRFGNAIFSRLPVGPVLRHLLPFPLEPGVPGMPRIAIEAILRTPLGEMRIITTHLEYYGERRRAAQVQALRALYAEGAAYARETGSSDMGGGPFASLERPAATILTGDFNFEPDHPLHARMLEPFGADIEPLLDAWSVANPGAPHPPTFKAHEPGSSPLHCDFIFVSEGLQSRLTRMEVYAATQASDHQPVLITLDGGDAG